MMANALGFIEMPNLADAIQTLDIMLKTAQIEFVTWEKKLGGRLVTIVVEGEISAVKSAVEAAKAETKGKIVAAAVIGNPHAETIKMVQLSSKNVRGKEFE